MAGATRTGSLKIRIQLRDLIAFGPGKAERLEASQAVMIQLP